MFATAARRLLVQPWGLRRTGQAMQGTSCGHGIDAFGRRVRRGSEVAGRHAPGSILSRMPPRPPDSHWRWPAPCGVCGSWSRSVGLCADCLQRFAVVVPRCQRCALRVPEGVELCGACIQSPPLFERTVAAFDYAFPWDRAIAAFKFSSITGVFLHPSRVRNSKCRWSRVGFISICFREHAEKRSATSNTKIVCFMRPLLG